MDDLGRRIKRLVERAVEDSDKDGRTTIASAINVGGSGSSAIAYSDDDVSIVTVNGRTTVLRHGKGTAQEASTDDPDPTGA
ncbi:MAG: hypothetical protein QOG39_66 [Acidimicrobiaceae bacterium]|jgi:hypothetical protein